MPLRQALNLVAMTLVERAEGEHSLKLDDLLKGRMTVDEFKAWVNSQKSPEDQTPQITEELKDELAELRAMQNGSSS